MDDPRPLLPLNEREAKIYDAGFRAGVEASARLVEPFSFASGRLMADAVREIRDNGGAR